MKQEKTTDSEQKTNFVETGFMELNIKVPNLVAENAPIIARDVRFALENCIKLLLMDEFTETRIVEYKETEGIK